MSSDGIQLQLTGKTFKFEFLQILGSVLESGAKSLLTIKTGGAWLAVAPNAISGLFGTFKGFKSEESQELRAWLLVSGGLVYALEKAIAETTFAKEPPPEALRKLVDDIGIRVETRSYTVEPDFFSYPNKLELLDDVSHELAAWGSQFGGNNKPRDAREKIQKHFPAGLHRAWVQNVVRFSPLEQALNSPFSPSLQFSRELEGYLQHIEEDFTQAKLIGQGDLNENAITLAQVFIPLRAYIAESQPEKNSLIDSSGVNPNPGSEQGKRKKRVVRLFAELESWIASAANQDVVRVVSGGPGIGKSSSIRAFAASVAKQGDVYPVLIPLQRLERADQPLSDRITHYFANTRYFKSGRPTCSASRWCCAAAWSN
jgi:hypothetical protein